MKICYCLHGLDNSGGLERIITLKVNYLVNTLGYDVYIIRSDKQLKENFYSLDYKVKIIDLGVNFSEGLKYSSARRLIIYSKKKKEYLDKFRKNVIDVVNPDIIISTFGMEFYPISKLETRARKIVEFHFSKYSRINEAKYAKKGVLRILYEYWKTYRESKVISRFNDLVVLTEQDQKLWNKDNSIVINNFKTFSPKLPASLIEKRVVAVGRFSPQKNFSILIDIWKDIHLKYPDWKLSIVGSGPQEQLLKEKIEKLNLKETIDLVAPTMNIDSLYLSSSIHVMTSIYEGMPMVMLEAKSFGIPSVAFDCECGPQDIIVDNIDGFLIKKDDTSMFVDRLGCLMNSFDLRQTMGLKAFDNSKKYNIGNIMTDWERLFKNNKI